MSNFPIGVPAPMWAARKHVLEAAATCFCSAMIWISVAGGAAASAAESNLVLHASFEEGTTADHSKGESRPLVESGVTITEGKVGRGLRLTEASRLAYSTRSNINAGSGTIALWIRPRWNVKGLNVNVGIFSCANERGSNSDLYVAYLPSKPGIGVNIDPLGTAFHVDKPRDLQPGEWHHVALSWNCEQGFTAYCDGELVMHKDCKWLPAPVSDRLVVGSGYRFHNTMSADIDDLLVFDRDLTQQEISQLKKSREDELPALAYSRPYVGPLNRLVSDPDYLRRHQQRQPLEFAPDIYDIKHGIVHYDKSTYCGHPRQVVFEYFGNGEMIVGHNHAPTDYGKRGQTKHDLGGYHSRAVQLLQRSLDGGVTWPKQYDVVLYDETKSTADKKKFLYPIDPPRADYDMFQKDSVFFFGRTYLPELRGEVPVCFALRSVDRGKTWETVPTIAKHPAGDLVKLHKDCYPVVRMPDGKTLLAAMSAGMSADNQRGVAIYESTDNGLHWNFKSRPAIDRSDTGQFTYTNLLLLPNGDLQAYFLHISKGKKAQNTPVDGLKDAICMATSHDGGKTWDDAVPIVGKGSSCWRNPGDEGEDVRYRSPWPIVLKDGRIVVHFARRRTPAGIGGVISSDRGKTWSHEFIIRDDGVGSDLGYPVGAQLEDGRIFIAYYYTMDDGNGSGGTRYIASSSFRIR